MIAEARRLAVAVAAAASVMLGCSRPQRERIVYATVAAAPELEEGAAVRFRGLDVGYVRSIGLTDSGVRLELLIRRRDLSLRADDRVGVRPAALFGTSIVDIVPGPASAPPLARGGTLAAAAPDTLAPVRDAVARAVVKEILEPILAPLLRRDTTDSASRRPAPER